MAEPWPRLLTSPPGSGARRPGKPADIILACSIILSQEAFAIPLNLARRIDSTSSRCPLQRGTLITMNNGRDKLIGDINKTLKGLSACYDPEELRSELSLGGQHRDCFIEEEDVLRGDPDKLAALSPDVLQNIAMAAEGMFVDLELAASSAPMYFADF